MTPEFPTIAYVQGTQSEVEDYAGARNVVMGTPIVGTHVGLPPHVIMPLSWDGQGENVPPGWTGYREPKDIGGSVWEVVSPDQQQVSVTAIASQASQADKNKIANATVVQKEHPNNGNQ